MPDLTQPSIHSARRERARTRRVPTSSHAFPDTRTHPSRAPFTRLHPRVASRRLHHRPPASPPPSASPARRHPTATTPPTTSGRTRDANAREEKNTSSPYPRAPLTVPLARTFAVVDTVVFIIVPIIVRAESSRRRVTSRRGGGGCGPRGVGVVFFLIDGL